MLLKCHSLLIKNRSSFFLPGSSQTSENKYLYMWFVKSFLVQQILKAHFLSSLETEYFFCLHKSLLFIWKFPCVPPFSLTQHHGFPGWMAAVWLFLLGVSMCPLLLPISSRSTHGILHTTLWWSTFCLMLRATLKIVYLSKTAMSPVVTNRFLRGCICWRYLS